MIRMEHPLRSFLKANNLSVQRFCEGRPFSYPTVYKLLNGQGTFNADTLIEIADATGGAVSVQTLIEIIKHKKRVERLNEQVV